MGRKAKKWKLARLADGAFETVSRVVTKASNVRDMKQLAGDEIEALGLRPTPDLPAHAATQRIRTRRNPGYELVPSGRVYLPRLPGRESNCPPPQ